MKKGFLILEIDGLSYKELKGAIKEGNAPFLNSLLKKEGFKLEKMYCGFPAIKLQAGLLYGKYPDIPGLTWFDKRKSQFGGLINIEDAREIERKWSKGILGKGMGIGIIFSGGSKKSFASAATLNLSVLLRHFPKYEIGFYLVIASFVLLIDLFASLVFRFERGVIFEGIFVDKIFRKYTFELAQEEIKNGCSPLYVNFAGYDRRVHKFGRESIFAKRIIRSIDEKIRRIYELAKESKVVNYDFFVLSDHGQAETVPFKDCFGKTLRRVIEEELKVEIEEGEELQKEIFINQIEKMVNSISWLRTTGWFLMALAKKYYQKSLLSSPKKVILISEGNFAHIYFTLKKKQLFSEETEKIYPGFLEFLLNHQGIRLLIVSSKKGIKIMSKKGEILLNRKEKLKGKDPLADAFDRKFVLDSIKGLAEMRNSGDIIIYSSRIKGKVVNFLSEFSCHGGVEKEEQEIFIISSPSCKYSFQGIKEPKRLYKFFKKYLKYI